MPKMKIRILIGALLFITAQAEAAKVVIDFDMEKKAFDPAFSNRSALEELKGYLAGDAKLCKLHYALGVHYSIVNNPFAREEFDKAIAECPNHAPSYYQLGAFDIYDKKYLSAITNLRSAIKLDPSITGAYSSLATAHLLLGDKQAAYDTLENAINSGIVSDAIYYNVSVIILYYYDKDLKKAEGYMRKAVKMSPDRDLYRSLLGFIFWKQRLFDEAIKEGEETIRLNPGNYMGYLLLAGAYREIKNYDYALKYAEKILLLKPDMKEIEVEIQELQALRAQ